MRSKINVILLIFLMLLCGVVGFIADANGYNRAMAEVDKAAAIASESARERQAQEQLSINTLASEYYKSVEKSIAVTDELNRLKRKIRTEKSKDECSNDENRHMWPANPAIYIMFNQAISHPDLPKNKRSRRPDEVGDGLDSIQYCGQESARLAIKVNKLQDLIKASSCFIGRQAQTK